MQAHTVPKLVPITVKAALKLVKLWHRHLPDLQGGLFAVAVADPELRGVGVAGNPARVWQKEAKLVISRVAIDSVPNGCSMVYGALARAAKALGYSEVWTYTLPDEPGTSLRAAGFEDMGLSAGGTHDRPSRSRKPPVRPEPKRRWRRSLNTEGTSCRPERPTPDRPALCYDCPPYKYPIDATRCGPCPRRSAH